MIITPKCDASQLNKINLQKAYNNQIELASFFPILKKRDLIFVFNRKQIGWETGKGRVMKIISNCNYCHRSKVIVVLILDN